jgi:hypothetical protein
MDERGGARRASDATGGLGPMYRRYVTGWASDYLCFRAACTWSLGRPTAAHEVDLPTTPSGTLD